MYFRMQKIYRNGVTPQLPTPPPVKKILDFLFEVDVWRLICVIMTVPFLLCISCSLYYM